MVTGAAQWLKRCFIPHEHNDHRPHILRTKTTIALVAAVLLIEAGFLAQTLFFSKTGLFATILQNVLVSETNRSRGGEDLPLLGESALLDVAATMKAEDMARKGYFAHVSPEGVSPWYWIAQAGYAYSYAGENLAINFSDSGDVVAAWLNSPAHRQNILSQHFTEMGIGTARGTYEGQETVFIVQMFGKPARIARAPQPVAVPPVPAAAEPLPGASGETFVAVRGAGTEPTVPDDAGDARRVGEPAPASAFAWKVIASPKTVSGYLYAALMAVVALALLLTVAVKPRLRHPHLIVNGVLMLLIVNAVLLFNRYLALAGSGVR